jgi:hypothetical protein
MAEMDANARTANEKALPAWFDNMGQLLCEIWVMIVLGLIVNVYVNNLVSFVFEKSR